MSFLKYDSTVKVENGYFCFHTITEFRGLDWKNLEQNNLKLKKLKQIQVLESNILLELKNITHNQKLLNSIEVAE